MITAVLIIEICLSSVSRHSVCSYLILCVCLSLFVYCA